MSINIFDYYKNPQIMSAIGTATKYISNSHDREDCRQEIFSELYSVMPMDTDDAIRLVDRVASKFKYDNSERIKHESSLEELFID
jgi:hypothetical protein